MNPVHEAVSLLRELGGLVATPGVDIETQKICNEHMQKILNTVIKKAVTDISASSSGIITK